MEQTLKYLQMWLEDPEVEALFGRDATKYREGEKAGERNGKKLGRKENQIEVAKKLLVKGMGISDIRDVTGLSESQIIKLKMNA